MNNIKGYGFRPSDKELIGYLQDIARDPDSLVQYITQLEDICEFEPWELPGLSALQPGCRVWYFIYSLNYKYQNSKLIKRVTKEGYWKSTGKPRKILMASNTIAEIGSKRSLVFHKGRPKDKTTKKSKIKHDNNKNKTKPGRNNRNKAVWVMHEYQLNTATSPNQKPLFLGKLMKQSEEASISNNKGAPNQDSPSNLRNQVSKDTVATTPEDRSQVSNNSGGVQNQSSTNEQDNDTQTDDTYSQERSNQHNFVNKNEVFNPTSNLGNYAAVDAITRASEHGNPSQNLIVIDNKTYPEERSNEHNNVVAENESSNLLGNDDAENFYPMDLSDYDLCNFDELLTMVETPDNGNMFQNQSSTNEQDAETMNSLS